MQANNFITKTSLNGVLKIERPVFPDDRGFFREVFWLKDLQKESGVKFSPVQWNHSMSRYKVIRGLHAENWNKLIYPVTGEIFAAIVDINPDSPNFLKHEAFTIKGSSYALFIPKGYANSICVTSQEDVHYMYLVDAYYDGKDTTAIAWDDPDININWPIKNPTISGRDRSNPYLRDLFPNKFKNEK